MLCEISFVNNAQLLRHKKSLHTRGANDSTESLVFPNIPIVDDLSLMDVVKPAKRSKRKLSLNFLNSEGIVEDTSILLMDDTFNVKVSPLEELSAPDLSMDLDHGPGGDSVKEIIISCDKCVSKTKRGLDRHFENFCSKCNI